MAGLVTQIGESFVGSGAEAAHLNTVLGSKSGPVGTAWVTALATPRAGHTAFVTILRPGIPAKPLTLFVNKAELAGPDHARLTWGPAQAGVASGVMDAVDDGIIERGLEDQVLIIAAVWVDPQAAEEPLVYANNRQATRLALEAGRNRAPSVGDALSVRNEPVNPYYQPGRES
jgi:5,6,7,8-tetrahydromethanopterin hydro-lyase